MFSVVSVCQLFCPWCSCTGPQPCPPHRAPALTLASSFCTVTHLGRYTQEVGIPGGRNRWGRYTQGGGYIPNTHYRYTDYLPPWYWHLVVATETYGWQAVGIHPTWMLSCTFIMVIFEKFNQILIFLSKEPLKESDEQPLENYLLISQNWVLFQQFDWNKYHCLQATENITITMR